MHTHTHTHTHTHKHTHTHTHTHKHSQALTHNAQSLRATQIKCNGTALPNLFVFLPQQLDLLLESLQEGLSSQFFVNVRKAQPVNQLNNVQIAVLVSTSESTSKPKPKPPIKRGSKRIAQRQKETKAEREQQNEPNRDSGRERDNKETETQSTTIQCKRKQTMVFFVWVVWCRSG